MIMEGHFIVLDGDDTISVPREVEECPYCDATITLHFEAWEEDEANPGLWTAEHAKADCDAEPDIGSEDWDDWWRGHSQMPYVYQLPVEMRMTEWVNEKYRFKLD